MGGRTKNTLIRTSTARDQRGNGAAPDFCPLIVVDRDQMPGGEGKTVKILDERPGRGSDQFSV
jgi:hypothetical protein